MTDTPAKSAPTPPPTSAAPAAPKANLPVPLVLGIVGAGLYILGAFLPFYNTGIPDADVPQMFDSLSGKVGILLILIGLLLVAVKQLGSLAVAAVGLAVGPVLRAVIDAASGDDLAISIINAGAGQDVASAGIGMYAALIGGAILMLAAFIPAKKKAKK